jgi:hypothetical protein
VRFQKQDLLALRHWRIEISSLNNDPIGVALKYLAKFARIELAYSDRMLIGFGRLIALEVVNHMILPFKAPQ